MDTLSEFDFTRWETPEDDPDLRRLLVSWLEYQRHEFTRKLRDLDPEGLTTWSVPPVELSVIGLVRHMTQMEHVGVVWGLGGGERRDFYGNDDFAGGSPESVDADLRAYLDEVARANDAIAAVESLDSKGLGHGWSLAATLIKMIHEYTLHSGQAHMIRFAALGELKR